MERVHVAEERDTGGGDWDARSGSVGAGSRSGTRGNPGKTQTARTGRPRATPRGS